MKNIVLAVTGASGSIYAERFIEVVSKKYNEITLNIIFTDTAKKVWKLERENDTDEFLKEIKNIHIVDNSSFNAPFCSGSASADLMIILPCSMGTIGRIASGISTDTIGRIADVQLKEKKMLIIVPRESPFNLIHLRNMTLLSEAGAIIAPASPSFYHNPEDIDTLVDSFIGRIIQLCGIDKLKEEYMWGIKKML